MEINKENVCVKSKNELNYFMFRSKIERFVKSWIVCRDL